jgi:hypothetical protein
MSHGKGRNMHGKVFAVRRLTTKGARQRQARQRLLCRAPRQIPTAKPLPCTSRFAMRCPTYVAGLSLSCVRLLCRACNLCRACVFSAEWISLPCVRSLPCTRLCRGPLSILYRAPATSTHGKEFAIIYVDRCGRAIRGMITMFTHMR